VDQDMLVGRERELADLERHLAAARAGSGALVLVDGDAGAGKTAAHQRRKLRKRRLAGKAWPWTADPYIQIFFATSACRR
jgi:hypothetical protein